MLPALPSCMHPIIQTECPHWQKVKQAFNNAIQRESGKSLAKKIEERVLSPFAFAKGVGKWGLKIIETGIQTSPSVLLYQQSQEVYHSFADHPSWSEEKQAQGKIFFQEAKKMATHPQKSLQRLWEGGKDFTTEKTLNFLHASRLQRMEQIGEVAPDLALLILGGIEARAANSLKIPSLEELKVATQAIDKGGELTKAGRALQKHGNRIPTAFPRPKGPPQTLNQIGNEIVEKILSGSDITIKLDNSGRFGKVIDIKTSQGKGLRFNSKGNFIGFLEPNK